MGNEEIARELLEEIDQRVENIEDHQLSMWGRFKRRYFNGKFGAGYFIGGNVTLLQVMLGKKFLAWLALKAPWLVTGATKLWGGITSTALGIIHWG